MGAAMRAGLAALIVLVVLRAELSRARADEDTALTILIHPRVVTTLQLPNEIVHTWIDHHGETRVARIRDKLYIRPRPGTPAGLEASLEVETRTARWTFRLLVVAHASDASREIRVVPVEAQAPEKWTEATLEVPAELPAPPLAVTPEAAEPATSAPSSAASPAPAEPVTPPLAVTPQAAKPATSAPSSAAGPAPSAAPAAPEPTEPEPTAPEPIDAPTAVTAMSPRLELSLHAFVGAGFAGLDVAGYEPLVGFQSLHAFGGRLAVARPGARWALEASVSRERPAGSMTFKNSDDSRLEVSGSWLRAEVGVRAQLARNGWTPSLSFGIGAQTHLRQTEEKRPSGRRVSLVSTMEHGGLAALGLRLQYRGRKVLLGLEFQARRGVPDDYHAEVVLGTIGFVLDEENEP